jgi:hypothetical protein
LARVLHVTIDDDRAAPPAFKSIDQIEAAMVAQHVAQQFTYDPTQPLPPPTMASRRRREHLPESDEAEAAPPSSPDTSSPSSEGEAKSPPSSVPPAPPAKVVQRPYLGDECCICYDKFTAECSVFFCEATCGKTVHQACFQRLVDFKQAPLCPYCRADMRPDGLILSKGRKRRRRA